MGPGGRRGSGPAPPTSSASATSGAAGVIRQVRLGPLDTQGTFKRNAPVQKQRRARLLDEHASSHRTTFLISNVSVTQPGLNAQVCSPVIKEATQHHHRNQKSSPAKTFHY